MQINEKHVAPIWGDHSFLLDGLRTILRIRATWADPPLKKDAAEVADVPSDFVRNYSNKQLPNLDIVKPPAMPNRNKRIKDKQQAPNQKKQFSEHFASNTVLPRRPLFPTWCSNTGDI